LPWYSLSPAPEPARPSRTPPGGSAPWSAPAGDRGRTEQSVREREVGFDIRLILTGWCFRFFRERGLYLF
jgi:hypothetical protein